MLCLICRAKSTTSRGMRPGSARMNSVDAGEPERDRQKARTIPRVLIALREAP